MRQVAAAYYLKQDVICTNKSLERKMGQEDLQSRYTDSILQIHVHHLFQTLKTQVVNIERAHLILIGPT